MSKETAVEVNEEPRLSIRLTAKWWIAVAVTLLAANLALPRIWWHFEQLPQQANYRMPYRDSQDYWLFRRVSERAARQDSILLLGDSVVWGEYVLPEQSLTASLNRLSDQTFSNGGINGMHPLAMSGLVSSHGRSLRDTRVVVHANLLWMSSPERDLRADEDVSFNHPELVPQFGMRLPSYQAAQAERLSNVIRQKSMLFTWVNHLRADGFSGQDLHHWTIEHPYDNPLTKLDLQLPMAGDKLRHRPGDWRSRGIQPSEMDWVGLQASLQWQGLRRVIRTLKQRNNQVFVVVGPLNSHMLRDTSRLELDELRRQAAESLREDDVAHTILPFLDSQLYADASHPVAAGYQQLAEALLRDATFVKWLAY